MQLVGWDTEQAAKRLLHVCHEKGVAQGMGSQGIKGDETNIKTKPKNEPNA